MSEKDLSFTLRVEGGDADDGILDIYDAANTMYGLARATNLVAHAFSNSDEVRKRGDSATGAKVFIHPSKKGCFEEQVKIIFSSAITQKIGHSVISKNFFDYLTWCWSEAVGITYEPSTPFVKKILLNKKKEAFIHDIAFTLENPMIYMQKTIKNNVNTNIYIERPMVGDILSLNQSTFNYVSETIVEPKKFNIIGNVTTFNILSDFGRMYSDADNKLISFNLSEPQDRIRDLATKSMNDYTKKLPGKVVFTVSKVTNKSGMLKRYIVHDVQSV